MVDEFEASGLDRAQFCRRRNLALSTLQRHPRARRSPTASGQARLVAVSVTPRALVFLLIGCFKRGIVLS